MGFYILIGVISLISWLVSRRLKSKFTYYSKIRLQNGLSVANYKFAFWQRVFAPLSVIIMILLAIPFVFASMRGATMGFRMLMGVMFGFGFYILNQFVGPMSVVYEVPPILAALLPSLVFAFISIIVLIRYKHV